PFETMTVGAVAFLDEDGPRDSQVLVFCEFSKKELQIICLKGNIRIEIAHNLIPQSSDAFVDGVDRMHFAREVSVLAGGSLNHFYPRIFWKVRAHDRGSRVGRSVVPTNPPHLQNYFADHVFAAF